MLQEGKQERFGGGGCCLPAFRWDRGPGKEAWVKPTVALHGGPPDRRSRPPGHTACADSVTFSPQNHPRKPSQHPHREGSVRPAGGRSRVLAQAPDGHRKHHRLVTHTQEGSGNKTPPFNTVWLKRLPLFRSKHCIHVALSEAAMKPQL